MRPDILPVKITGELSKDEWFSYFKSISYDNNLAGNYKVSAGLFKSFDYMEYYYTNSIKNLNRYSYDTNTIFSKYKENIRSYWDD